MTPRSHPPLSCVAVRVVWATPVLTQLAVAKGDEKKDPKLFPPGRYDEHGQQVPPSP